MLYSNCQGIGIIKFLSKVIKKAQYIHIENYKLINEKKPINKKILKEIDIFIYQPIDKRHGIYSTDVNIDNCIINLLEETCIKIAFPYIYNSSLWAFPLVSHGDGLIGDLKLMDQYINSNKTNINKEPILNLKEKGLSLNEIIKLYYLGNIDFEYQKRFNENIKILKLKEQKCDIFVSRYIQDNISKIPLFITQNHPTSYLFIHCVNQILDILKYENKLETEDYDLNEAKLPGKCIHCQNDIKFWKFQYKITNISDSNNLNCIRSIYNS